MNWFKRLFMRRDLKRSVEAQIKALDRPETEFIPTTPPFAGVSEKAEEMTVTQQYSILGDEIDRAVAAKRDARDAAVRVTTSIGAVPSSPTPGPDRGLKIPPGK